MTAISEVRTVMFPQTVSETKHEYFVTYGLSQLAFLAVPANPALANVVVIGVDVVDGTPPIAEGCCNWNQS
jgi:hypothetical protein